MINETQETIGKWGWETFPEATSSAIAGKLAEEAEELQQAILDARFKRVDVEGEIADVYILLAQIAYNFDISIQEAVNKKMPVNRVRKWNYREDGTAQHV